MNLSYNLNNFIINEYLFFAKVQIDESKKLFQYGLYNIYGKCLTRAIFDVDDYPNTTTMEIYPGLSIYRTRESEGTIYYFTEKPIAYYKQGETKVKFLNKERRSKLKIYRVNYLKLDLDKNKYFLLPKNPNKEFSVFYASDKEYGLFYLALYILEIDLKVKDTKDATRKYLEETENIKSDNKKIQIAKSIISEYIPAYKLEEEEKERLRLKKIKEEREKQSDYCYIATSVYGDLNHPKTIEFRKFRDKFLNNFLFGRLFTKLYYLTSPKLLKFIENKPNSKKILNFIIEKIRINIVRKIMNDDNNAIYR